MGTVFQWYPEWNDSKNRDGRRDPTAPITNRTGPGAGAAPPDVMATTHSIPVVDDDHFTAEVLEAKAPSSSTSPRPGARPAG